MQNINLCIMIHSWSCDCFMWRSRWTTSWSNCYVRMITSIVTVFYRNSSNAFFSLFLTVIVMPWVKISYWQQVFKQQSHTSQSNDLSLLQDAIKLSCLTLCHVETVPVVGAKFSRTKQISSWVQVTAKTLSFSPK